MRRLADSVVVGAMLALSGGAVAGSDVLPVKAGTPNMARADGGVLVEGRKTQATVAWIDANNRKLVLVTPDGRTQAVKAGPGVTNFHHIQVGKQIKAVLTEEVVVYMGTNSPSDGTATLVPVVPLGGKEGKLWAETTQSRATVTALDLTARKVSLQLPDGTSRNFGVANEVDLTQRKVGEQIFIRAAQPVAISVDTSCDCPNAPDSVVRTPKDLYNYR